MIKHRSTPIKSMLFFILMCLLLVGFTNRGASSAGYKAPKPTKTPTPSRTSTPTRTPTRTPTSTRTPSLTPTITNTPLPTGTPFACQTWNLASDFRISPSQENPNRDSCNNVGVWKFMGSTDLTRNPATYFLLPNFNPAAAGVSGLNQWNGTSSDGHISFNASGSTYSSGAITWPANTIDVHPGPSRLVVMAWQSPLTGFVSITGIVDDNNPFMGNCNAQDGIRWYLDKNTTSLASGIIANGGAQSFADGTGGAELNTVAVNTGDMIYLAIHPDSNWYCDDTGVDLVISATNPPTETPTPTATFTPSPTVTPTYTPTATFTPSPTMTATIMPTATNTLVPVACGQQASYTVIDTYTYEANTIYSNAPLSENRELSNEDAVKQVVQSYFVFRYESEKNLIREDFSLIATNEDSDTVNWLHREGSRQNIFLYNAELFNTQYLDYKFSLDYIDFDINDSQATILLLENHWVRYESSPDFVSNLANMEHAITLKKIDDRWLIVTDEYPMDLTNRALETMTEEEILNNIQQNYEMQFLGVTTPESEMTAATSNLTDSMLVTYPYNNSAAKSYADNWYSTTGPVPSYIKNQPGWNSSWPALYCKYSEVDCTNFVSQALFEGTGYTFSQLDYFNPDYTHYMDWWYYNFSPPVDGSYPWVNTGGLYDFLTTNTGRGPYGSATNLCSLSPGDIIFMKNSSGEWRHAVMVSDILGDCASASNIIVDSHDPYMQGPLNDPLFTQYIWHPVMVVGYRK